MIVKRIIFRKTKCTVTDKLLSIWSGNLTTIWSRLVATNNCGTCGAQAANITHLREMQRVSLWSGLLPQSWTWSELRLLAATTEWIHRHGKEYGRAVRCWAAKSSVLPIAEEIASGSVLARTGYRSRASLSQIVEARFFSRLCSCWSGNS